MRKKNRGSYYTPEALAEVVVRHALAKRPRSKRLSILEPSCGDGVFIEATNNYVEKNKKMICTIDAVEINKPACKNAKRRPKNNLQKVDIHCKDFFSFLKNKRKKYDLILGNPPYVVKKRLSKTTIKSCEQIYSDAGLPTQNFHNIWAGFLIASTTCLTDNGILAYVLPAELLQVKFSQEIRSLLQDRFARIEIVTFKDIVFDNIGQDTILLFCYKTAEEKGLFFASVKNTEALKGADIKFQRKNLPAEGSFKWTSHTLTQGELDLISTLKKKFLPMSNFCDAAAGIVTAANEYFIVNEDTLEEYNLQKFSLPIIQRGVFVNGSVAFTKKDYTHLKKAGKPCHLLFFDKVPSKNIPKKLQEYLDLGESMGISNRYKCVRRKPWYLIPGVWETEGFFFKRSHLYPKILSNKAKVMVTDSAYRIKPHKKYKMDSLVYSFYNSLTLSLAELEGRAYGEGVLELTPNEFKNLAVPYVEIDKEKFKKFTDKFESKNQIGDILKKNDKDILQKKYLLNDSMVESLYKIQEKLRDKRIG